MNIEAVRSVLKGNLEAIIQGVNLISSLNDEQYTFVAAPYIKSSIAEHFRHVLDMYFAITRRLGGDVADYDKRRRGDLVEVDRQQAIIELTEVKNWFNELDLSLRNLSRHCERYNDIRMEIKTEVTLKETERVLVPTTLVRELVFTGSHAVHHYAIISIIAKLQGLDIDEKFGVAPATASFRRDEIGCAQ